MPPCQQAGLFFFCQLGVLWLATSEGVNIFRISPSLPCLAPTIFLPIIFIGEHLQKKKTNKKKENPCILQVCLKTINSLVNSFLKHYNQVSFIPRIPIYYT